MKNGLRKFIPAGAVAVVLAFSYVAPAFGIDPVKSSTAVPCGSRYGGAYSGGKHLSVCPGYGALGKPDNSPAVPNSAGGPNGSNGSASGETALNTTASGSNASANGTSQGNASLTANQLAQTGQPFSGTDSLPFALGLGLVAMVAAGGVLVFTRRRT